MPPKQQDVVKRNISPVLFMTVDGEAMTFYLRPGPIKSNLRPLIEAGGGLLCNLQQPGAILLIDPAERGNITESTAHRYISTQYIRDCVEKDEQLNLEDYRLNPEAVPNQPAKLSSNKGSSAANLAGRSAYTSEEDAAILKFVSEHKSEVGGNRLWQEMEKQKVTSHSWQSMKYRYRVRLVKKQSEVVEEKITEEEMEAAERVNKVEENQEANVERPSSAEDASPPPPPAHSAGSDLTQKDLPSVPDDSKQLEIAEVQTSVSPPEEEMQPVSAHTEKQLSEGTKPETEESETSIMLEEPFSEFKKDFHLFLPETQDPETEEQQAVMSAQKESVPEDSPAAHFVSQDVSPQKKPKEKIMISSEPEQPQRRRTRRQLQLDELLGPEPYGKKLRSSSSSASSSPQLLRRIKPTVRSAFRRDKIAEQPSSKTARGKRAPVVQESDVAERERAAAAQESEAAVQESEVEMLTSEAAVQESEVEMLTSEAAVQESEVEMLTSEATVQESEVEMLTSEAAVQETQQEEAGLSNVQKTAEPDTESVSVPQKVEKKKEKRKLGILEAATKEFEDDSESDEDETPDLQKQRETAALQPTPSEPSSNTAVDAASTQSNPECAPCLQDVVSETQIQASISNLPPQMICPASKPHQFIFDIESQEEEVQSTVGEETEDPPVRKEMGNKSAPYSLTQAQLEGDKRRITELMNQTNQDLFSVTKALLKASGDFSAALNLLMHPGCTSGPIWDRHDDNLLLSADPEVRQQLQEKYGEEALVKRILFLEVEG